jgi:predicted NBD/HSP70 family sugar kinase
MKKILTIDIGGTNIKFLAAGQTEVQKFPSGPTMTPSVMVATIQSKIASLNWEFDAVSVGYPGVISKGKIVNEPHNLATGWVGFDFDAALGRPVRLMNDAAMQALGSYQEGLSLFIGLGTGLGSAVVAEKVVIPMELAHLTYRKGTFEDYIGRRGLERMGKKKWTHHVHFIVERLVGALNPDDVVLGGGNAKKLKSIPGGCRLGSNALAFQGGFRLWEN